ncbi:hypothetical protein PV326_010394 [Microctonus aethiopoides]|nr:hypothetical protein PV326_010394 [Microctonus aethiopoides]
MAMAGQGLKSQRLADEEDATQLQSNRVVGSLATVTTAGLNNATTTAAVTTTLNDGAMPHFGNQISHRSTPPAMDTLRDLQELLRVKDEKIMELETLLCKRDIEIQDLRSHLDKFLSVLPFKSPLTPTKPRPRKQRAQGISAEPPLQQLTPLNFYDKSDSVVDSATVLSTAPTVRPLTSSSLSSSSDCLH